MNERQKIWLEGWCLGFTLGFIVYFTGEFIFYNILGR
jgi:hypothetical protein